MAPEKAPHDLLKRLLDAQQISKEMLEKSDKISSNQVVLGELRNKFNTINCLLKYDFTSGFLDKNVILGRLAPLNANEKYIVAVVATINLSLASYRVLTKTQIQWVLKNLFTNIVPVGTDISAGVGIAYKTLLHTTIMDLPSEPLRTKLTRMWYKIRNYVPIPLDLDADACYHLLQMENECLDSLRDNMAPARAEEYTSNWIAAMSLMINKVPNEITDGIAEAVIEEDSKDKDIFYESVEFQDEGIFVDEDIFVDAVSDQQPTTPSSVSRKRKNTCDSEDSDAVSQSQSDDEAATKKRKTLTDTGDLYQPAPINDIREPKVSSIIKRTNRGAISKPPVKARLRQLLKKWL